MFLRTHARLVALLPFGVALMLVVAAPPIYAAPPANVLPPRERSSLADHPARPERLGADKLPLREMAAVAGEDRSTFLSGNGTSTPLAFDGGLFAEVGTSRLMRKPVETAISLAIVLAVVAPALCRGKRYG